LLSLIEYQLKMEKEQMDKKDVEKELSSLLARTSSWEDELNSLISMDD